MKTQILIFGLFAPFAVFAAPDPYASFVVSATGLGSDPWTNQPSAILGAPSVDNIDTVNGGTNQMVSSSLVYAPWRQTAGGANALCTIPNGAEVIIGFHEPIVNDPRNWDGKDFIVFGNAFFLNSQGTITATTNMSAVTITSSTIFAEPVTVSVSPDLIQWYTYTSPVADSFWPTQGRLWQGLSWGREHLFNKPVPASLTPNQMVGKTVAQAIALLDRSGGGTAFDLTPSGFASIRYLRFRSNGGEVDAVARVGTARARGEITIVDPRQRLR